MNSGSTWVAPLWRAVLRTSRTFDEDPLARTLLNPRGLIRAAMQRGPLSSPSRATSDSEALAGWTLDAAMTELRQGCAEPSKCAGVSEVHSPILLRSALARQRRALHLTTSPDALGDAGFALLRDLSAVAELSERLLDPPAAPPLRPPEVAPTDPELAAAPPPRRLAPRAGSLLAAHPFAKNVSLQEHTWAYAPSVLLMVRGASERSNGVGLVTNAKSKLKLCHHDWMNALSVPVGGVFATNPVYYGGDASLATLTMLHPYGHLVGSRCIAKGVYEGGCLTDAAQLVRSGKAEPSDFAFFRGLVEFRSGELEERASHGEWLTCVAQVASVQEVMGGAMSAACNGPAAAGSGVDADALAEDERMRASWQAWASLVAHLGPPHDAFLRVRPEGIRALIERVSLTPSVRQALLDGGDGGAEPERGDQARPRGANGTWPRIAGADGGYSERDP
jgi:putative AlgH/UPF0301 family transcriptional regulator